MQVDRRRQPSAALIVAAVALVAALAGTAIAGPSGAMEKIDRKQVKAIAAKQVNKLAPGIADRRIDARAPGLLVASAATAQTFDPDATLRSGDTLTGVWAVSGVTGQNAPAAITFTPRLPGSLGAGAVHRLVSGATSAACPGPGSAAAGNLCVYERAASGVTFNTIGDPATGNNGADRRGAVIQYIGIATSGYADGTWAVGAP